MVLGLHVILAAEEDRTSYLLNLFRVVLPMGLPRLVSFCLVRGVPLNTVLEFHRVGEEGDDIRGATLHQPSLPPLGGLGSLDLDFTSGCS